MNEWAYVLIEYYLNGCRAGIQVVAVTLDQTYAYQWQQQTSIDEFTTREARQVPLLPPTP